MRSGTVILLVLFGLLAASLGVAFWAWVELGEAAISVHGWIALGLGAALTMLVGMGLMALLFLSSRWGYDERAHQGEEPGLQQRHEPLDGP